MQVTKVFADAAAHRGIRAADLAREAFRTLLSHLGQRVGHRAAHHDVWILQRSRESRHEDQGSHAYLSKTFCCQLSNERMHAVQPVRQSCCTNVAHTGQSASYGVANTGIRILQPARERPGMAGDMLAQVLKRLHGNAPQLGIWFVQAIYETRGVLSSLLAHGAQDSRSTPLHQLVTMNDQICKRSSSRITKSLQSLPGGLPHGLLCVAETLGNRHRVRSSAQLAHLPKRNYGANPNLRIAMLELTADGLYAMGHRVPTCAWGDGSRLGRARFVVSVRCHCFCGFPRKSLRFLKDRAPLLPDHGRS
mmetsp:Transcript_9485/g.17318  ORF Transcript_9485/g.17318 Transcript_9485/m.17318 type:complete len:306 (-) Transcript_9485:255-1172(-)